METIVVGVDGSECSRAALRFAVAEARLRKARLRVVHAWAVPPVSTYHEAEHAIRTDFDGIHDAAQALLDEVVDEALGDDSDIVVEKVVVEGPPAAALVAPREMLNSSSSAPADWAASRLFFLALLASSAPITRPARS